MSKGKSGKKKKGKGGKAGRIYNIQMSFQSFDQGGMFTVRVGCLRLGWDVYGQGGMFLVRVGCFWLGFNDLWLRDIYGQCTDGNTVFGGDSDKNSLVIIYMF